MNAYEIGKLVGLVLLIASVVAGWRAVPFKWVALVAAGLFAAGLAVGASWGISLVAVVAFLFWYGVARGIRRLFGGGEGYSAP